MLLYGRRRIGLDLGSGVQRVRYASTFQDEGIVGGDRTRTVLEHRQDRDPRVKWQRALTVFRVAVSGAGGDIRPQPGQRIPAGVGSRAASSCS